jgi:hypothetical protein
LGAITKNMPVNYGIVLQIKVLHTRNPINDNCNLSNQSLNCINQNPIFMGR